jgi:GrpB-like predicted nucleotidyltransferase (UPF0157 family)
MSSLLILEPHRESWKHGFESEAARIMAALGPTLQILHHIGSTSIPGIHAKPIIDILAEVESLECLDASRHAWEQLGYEVMGEFGIPGRRYFRKSIAGIRTHHVHAFSIGSPDLARHLAFRDFLRCHPPIAQEYSALKLSLANSCHGDIDAYMDGKDAFVKETERMALDWFAENERILPKAKDCGSPR